MQVISGFPGVFVFWRANSMRAKRRLSEMFMLRLSHHDKRRLEQAATNRGLSAAEFARFSLREGLLRLLHKLPANEPREVEPA